MVTSTSTLLCPVCQSPSTFDQECKDARIHLCAQCHHRFSDLSSLRNVEHYGADYYEKNWFQNGNIPLFDLVCEQIDKLKATTLLDVGCGNGAFLKYMRKKRPNLSLTGVDLSFNAPENGIEYIQGDILKTDFPKQYDVIVSLAVIEHLDDVRSFTTRLFELCVPGGIAVVMTMNDTSLLYGIARSVKKIGFNQPTDQLYSSHHLNHFSKRSLARLMQECGFSVTGTVMHDIPLDAVDITSGNPLHQMIMRVGVWGIFRIGGLTQNTYLQTISCRRPVSQA